ncbi:MAG: hypothetical protein AAF547_17675 [Actinomycetota bacterium]
MVTGGIVGFAIALVVMCLAWYLGTRSARDKHGREIARLDESILDLRQERAEDKETNRRLRHQLASNTPDRLLEATAHAELERDAVLVERDQALEQLELVRQDLGQATRRLADRESKLRQYREALKEIRLSLEAQDPNRTARAADGLIDTDTAEVPADAVAEAAKVAALAEAAGVDPDEHLDELEDDHSVDGETLVEDGLGGDALLEAERADVAD